MRKQAGRYSVYIRPFTYLLDLFIINASAFYWINEQFESVWYHLLLSLSWIIVAWNVRFYEVYRFTKVIDIFERIIKQFIFFSVLSFAYSGFGFDGLTPFQILKWIFFSLSIVSAAKFFVYFFLRQFRIVFGGNFRRVVVIGYSKDSQDLIDFFNDNPDYGYNLVRVFPIKGYKKSQVEECFQFVLEKNIDEIYCSMTDLSSHVVKQFVDFSDNNLKSLKFLPDKKTLFSGNTNFDYYGYLPVISARHIPLDNPINKFVKRLFDLIFSLLIIAGILSWLTPLLALFIKLESKGPVFFKQKRNGLNYKEFYCYKFRSMRPNEIADLEQVSKNDPRITKIGKIIRKTSIDELPQFFNVLFGDMSVVGPRPHMVSHTEMYARSVDKFMVRHFIKPGITGLAQTNGFRGEVESSYDIVNRVKYDIFYVENWSILLDLKIISLTVYNAFKGEEKAY